MKTILALAFWAATLPAFGQITMTVDAALGEVPVNIMPLVDDDDFVTVKGAVAYNETGLALYWHFTTTAGATTVTAVTPTTGGAYDWSEGGSDTTAGMYYIEIPASGGASINNDTEGFGYFTGIATDVVVWRGPIIQFVKANVADSLVNGTDNLDVNAAEAGGTAWGSGAITAGSIATDAITNAEVATGALVAGTEISGLLTTGDITTGVWNAAVGSYGGANTYGQAVEDIIVDTAEIGTAGAGLTNINLPNQTMDITGTLSGAVTLAADQSAVTSFGGATTVMALKSLTIANADAGASAVTITGSGTGNSHGINVSSTNGKGIAIGSTNSVGMSIDGAGATDFQVGGVSANFAAWNATLQADTAYDATTVNGVLETTFVTPTP